MNAIEKINVINEIYSKLCDEESRQLFLARLEHVFDRDNEKLKEKMWLCSEYREYTNYEIQSYYMTHSKKKNIIFGAEKFGAKNREMLKKLGVSVEYYCDNNKSKVGKQFDGLTVLGVDEVCQNYREYTVIIGSKSHRMDMYDQLITDFFPIGNILYLRHGEVELLCESQYFDFSEIGPKKNNCFVDAGAFDGSSTKDYIKWCNGNYEKIFCFEPNENNYKNVISNLSDMENITIINEGTWSEKKQLRFALNGPASKITDNKDGIETIEVTSIDQVVKGNQVSFIKMDVEGAEMESLIGAKETIKKYKPDLAICIYHKMFDFIDIPSYILELVPEYKLAIRHYANNTSESVLFAYI